MNSNSITVTVLMPCLNEAQTLERCIRMAQQWAAGFEYAVEILVADNGSTDGSIEIAKRCGARVVPVGVRGYGAALAAGCREARGEFIVFADADASYDLSKLQPFVDKLAQGYDVVIGNRFAGGIAPGAMPWKNRYIGNPALTRIGRLLFDCDLHDFHCGIRGLRKSAFLAMDLQTTGMEFASEMIIKARLLDLKMTEVPTTLSVDGRNRPPHLRPWRDGWRHLRFMLLFSPRWLFLIPGLLLFTMCTGAYAALVSGPVEVFGVHFDVHTLFFAQCGMIVGALSVFFGIVARVYAMREGLLPQHAALQRLRRSPALEIGLVLGLLAVLAGLALGGAALNVWGEFGFGALPYGSLLRLISLSTTLIMLGSLVALAAFLFGVLALPTKARPALGES